MEVVGWSGDEVEELGLEVLLGWAIGRLDGLPDRIIEDAGSVWGLCDETLGGLVCDIVLFLVGDFLHWEGFLKGCVPGVAFEMDALLSD